MIDCRIYHLIEGAKQATGLTVIIDVFRAFSVECYLYETGALQVRPVGSLDAAKALHDKIPGSVLVGERHGIRCEGFDFGNSPSQIAAEPEKIRGRVCIHTTSAGTQGIVNAAGADEIVTGSLVNAKAIAAYIRKRAQEAEAKGQTVFPVSLVAMGRSGREQTEEDELCAEYIRDLLEEKGIPPSFEKRRQDLRYADGKRFFDPDLQEHFPEADYWMCIRNDVFPYVLCIRKDENGYYCEKVTVHN